VRFNVAACHYRNLFGEFSRHCSRILVGGRLAVDLIAQLLDYGIERQLVVFRVGFELGVEPTADRGGRAAVPVGDKHPVRVVGQKSFSVIWNW
jgi:hypothetical protein